jgi:hypothetical protein
MGINTFTGQAFTRPLNIFLREEYPRERERDKEQFSSRLVA